MPTIITAFIIQPITHQPTLIAFQPTAIAFQPTPRIHSQLTRSKTIKQLTIIEIHPTIFNTHGDAITEQHNFSETNIPSTITITHIKVHIIEVNPDI